MWWYFKQWLKVQGPMFFRLLHYACLIAAVVLLRDTPLGAFLLRTDVMTYILFANAFWLGYLYYEKGWRPFPGIWVAIHVLLVADLILRRL